MGIHADDLIDREEAEPEPQMPDVQCGVCGQRLDSIAGMYPDCCRRPECPYWSPVGVERMFR